MEPPMTQPAAVLDAVELQTGSSPDAAVIWLHGLGADGHDFVPIVRELDALGAPKARYVFPHAPQRAVTINGGMVMRAWYDILGTDLARIEDEAGIRASQAAVTRLVEREIARGIAPDRIVLGGFSQGGAITLQAGLRLATPIAALVVLSSYLPLAARAAAERSPTAGAVPIFMAHGRLDPVIPLDRGTRSRDQLAALGQRVEWHEYLMEHSVCEDELRDLGAFLQRVVPLR
jgi:phospholipase/carboxylesterase